MSIKDFDAECEHLALYADNLRQLADQHAAPPRMADDVAFLQELLESGQLEAANA